MGRRYVMLCLSLLACDQNEKPQASSVEPSPPSGPAAQQVRPTSEARMPASVEPACLQHCAKLAKLGCAKYPTALCVQDCMRLDQIPVCQAESRALKLCTLSAPVSQFECDAQGVASIKAGACRDAENKMLACVDAQIAERTR